MATWEPGYSRAQLEAAQERYGLIFPPDLFALLLERQPAGAYDWSIEDSRIRAMLDWPFELLQFDVEHGLWWRDWGERPSTLEASIAVLRQALSDAPKLIPLYGHRFLPETPNEVGNPVFSMHGFDTIYYGADLTE